MASAERVQEYLQRHKVGVLFEDLMAKVISDMPDDPVLYLARVLTLRSDRKETRGTRKPGEQDIGATKKSHDKPWTTNSKRLKPKDLDTRTGKKTAKPEWDPDTKAGHVTGHVTSSLDDIWDDSRQTRKGTRSPTKPSPAGVTGWADANFGAGEDVMYDMYGYRGPHKARHGSDNTLDGEMLLAKETKFVATKPQIYNCSRRSGRGVDAARHKAALQRYISLSDARTDSGYEESGSQSDDAIELMEDMEDLRREGVKNAKQTGVRIRNSGRSSAQTAVRVSICARCAKVMGSSVPSHSSPGAKFDDLTDYDCVTQREPITSHVQSVRLDDVSDDEEFESVSQVTGPRRPVWQDSDTEAVTPRKGRHMLTSNMSPSKGLPMYSGDQPQKSSRGQRSVTSPTKSAQFLDHKPRGADTDLMRMTWSPHMGAAQYSENKPQTARTVTIATDRTDKDEDIGDETARTAGTGWQVPPDYDTDSSFYGSPGANRPTRLDRAY